MKKIVLALALAATAALSVGGTAQAQDALTITIKDHKFEPDELKVPANKRITLTVINDDPSPEEFESSGLKVEKVIPGKSKATVQFGPLKAGTYKFEGEFNSKTAKGVVIAE
jgi:plastocyanin domain-containing protein